MRYSADVNLTLGILMLGIGLAAAILQSWLWTFPMAPDPGGSDPNGVTTAPKFWRMVHRWLGYVFALIYVLLAIQMVPRIWQFESEAWSTGVVLHSVLGLGIGALLGIKIWILRRGQKHGKKLPWFGWGMVALSIGRWGGLPTGYKRDPETLIFRWSDDNSRGRNCPQDCAQKLHSMPWAQRSRWPEGR